MELFQTKLTERAWVSSFWAQYLKLPDIYKEIFFSLVQDIAQESGNKKQVNAPILYDVQSGGSL
jgi:hypothetical protein